MTGALMNILLGMSNTFSRLDTTLPKHINICKSILIINEQVHQDTDARFVKLIRHTLGPCTYLN